MVSLSQALRLGGLLPPHSAFQGHAAHLMRWPMRLSPNGSRGTCIPQGLVTFLHAAFTAHRWHATTTVAPLSCPRNSTSHRALRAARGAGPTRQPGRSRPRPALGADAATRPDSSAGGEVPFFNSFKTVVGLTCSTRAVSRMPLAFIARSTIWRLTSGDCPA